MQEIRITGHGAYLPRLRHTNDTLPALDPPVSAAELDRIGVSSRHWAREDETGPDMAVEAAEMALSRAGLRASELDLLIFANWTSRRYVPDVAPAVAHRLGAKNAFAHDICCACAGFVFGVGTAHAHLQNPRYRRALVVAADTSSRHVRPGSKGTLIFGDAAGAFVLERGAVHGGRLIDFELCTDGSQHHVLDVSAAGHVQTHVPQKELVTLAGESFAKACGRVLARQELTLADVKWVVPHSGTAGVQAMVAKHLGFPGERILTNFGSIGNVTTAAIPAALHHFLEVGPIRPGDLVLSATVGAGWQYAAMLYTAPGEA